MRLICWKRLRGLFALGVLFATMLVAGGSNAMPLQDIVQSTQPSVAHLGILDRNGEEIGHGSGFVISPEGRVVTNFHVIEEAARMVAIFAGGKKAEVVGVWAFDKSQDLAVLQLAEGTYPIVALSSSAPKQGDEVIVIGSPLGLEGSVSTGIVSAVRSEGAIALADRKEESDRGKSWGLQISAAVSPGSSGSPVLDAEGKVMGVAVGIYGGAMGGQALNFAVPISKLRELLATIPIGARPRSLTTVGSGRSVTTNLLISAGGLGAVALVWWIAAWINGRKDKPRARHGLH
jgi:S1-C subfamily serine protease